MIISDSDQKFRLYYTQGDDTNAWSVYPGFSYDESELNLGSGLTVYVQSFYDNNELRIIYWT